MVRRDVEAAAPAYPDEQGRFFDYHNLRHRLVQSLAAGGDHPKVTQEPARHSDVDPTMLRSSHLTKTDEQRAVESLLGIQGLRRRRRESA